MQVGCLARMDVSAPLRWTLALVAVCALGFAAGRFLGRDGSATPELVTFPVVAPAGPAVSGSPAPAQGLPRRIPATIHEILKLPGDFAQTTALYVLAESQDQDGIERLLAEARSIKRVSESRAAASILYGRFAELDPEAAVEHMMRGDSGLDPDLLYGVFHSWARTDLEAALKGASKLDDHSRQMAGMAIVRSRDDLPLEEREAMGSKLNLQASIREPTASDLRSPKAAERAWQSALAMGDREARERELYQLARNWGQQDPEAAIRAIEALRDRSQRDQMLQIAIHAWAEKDGRQAADWTLERPPSQQRSELLSSVLSVLVKKDPAAAMAIMERLRPTEREQVMPNVLMNWASHDPRAVTAWIGKQDNRQMYVPALSYIVSVLAEQDPEDALRWASTLSGEESQMAMAQVIQRIALDDPERATALVGQMDEGPYRNSAMSGIAQVLAQSDPRAALSWVAKQSHTESAPELYQSVFEQWALYDPDGAVSQLNFILEPDTRNAAIMGILGTQYLDPDLIGTLYQRIEGAEARTLAAGRIYYQLREIDPQAAERYRIQAGISDERGEGSIVVN